MSLLNQLGCSAFGPQHETSEYEEVDDTQDNWDCKVNEEPEQEPNYRSSKYSKDQIEQNEPIVDRHFPSKWFQDRVHVFDCVVEMKSREPSILYFWLFELLFSNDKFWLAFCVSQYLKLFRWSRWKVSEIGERFLLLHVLLLGVLEICWGGAIGYSRVVIGCQDLRQWLSSKVHDRVQVLNIPLLCCDIGVL